MGSESIKRSEEAILRIAQSEKDKSALRQHVREIVEGAAFKGIDRSSRFLEYAVDRALAGEFDALKERSIGSHLFGRPDSYDTNVDSIVRVTASDVRKRLLQHYGMYGNNGRFRIDLPKRSYVPEIVSNDGGVQSSDAADLPGLAPQQELAPAAAHSFSAIWARLGSRTRHSLLAAALVLALAASWAVGRYTARAGELNAQRAQLPLPWSTFFSTRHITHVITSDPNIAEIQRFVRQRISVADYANHIYVPEPNTLTPEESRFCHAILRGDKAASADVPVTASIAELAQAGAGRLSAQTARNMQLADLSSEDNFVFLGSPLSNPWVSLFDKSLDFRYEFDDNLKAEVIRNVHPRAGERNDYVATRVSATSIGNTGQSFAIVAFIQNPDQNGHVLILAGETAEGTEAAGKLVTDLPRLSDVLHRCGATPSSSQQHFELLLHLESIAGSPSTTEVVACHLLSDPK